MKTLNPSDVQHTPGPWHEGSNNCARVYGAIVSDSPIEGQNMMPEDVTHYGGQLIAESIAPCNRPIISAAPDMLEALENLENDADQIPEHAWKLVQAAIAKARGRS